MRLGLEGCGLWVLKIKGRGGWGCGKSVNHICEKPMKQGVGGFGGGKLFLCMKQGVGGFGGGEGGIIPVCEKSII